MTSSTNIYIIEKVLAYSPYPILTKSFCHISTGKVTSMSISINETFQNISYSIRMIQIFGNVIAKYPFSICVCAI